MKINKERFLKNLNAQGEIGWVDGQGLNRLLFSPELVEARDFLVEVFKQYDIPTEVDPLGNLFATVEGENPDAIILSGSHLDSVKNGGILDGAYGVMAAQEVALTLKENNVPLRNTYQVVAFNAEEGSPLGGSFGSRAFSGLVEQMPSKEALAVYGLTEEDVEAANVADERYKGFVELHIEQGPVLDKNGIPVAIPQAIVGITRYRCVVHGEGNHSGTTPMVDRKDALYETMKVLLPWLEEMHNEPVMVCNVGEFSIFPGHVAVVPERVDFVVEIRALTDEDVDRAVDNLKRALDSVENCRAEYRLEVSKPPVELDPVIRKTVAQVTAANGFTAPEMPSGASHDASALSHKVPAGMIFVPNIKRISHHKDEETRESDLLNGVQLLLEVILELDKSL